jgi:hypothetical protein
MGDLFLSMGTKEPKKRLRFFSSRDVIGLRHLQKEAKLPSKISVSFWLSKKEMPLRSMEV